MLCFSSGGFSANLNLSTLNGSNGFVINGDAYDNLGASVQQAMSMAMALMTSHWGSLLPQRSKMLARAMLCLAQQEDSVPTST